MPSPHDNAAKDREPMHTPKKTKHEWESRQLRHQAQETISLRYVGRISSICKLKEKNVVLADPDRADISGQQEARCASKKLLW